MVAALFLFLLAVAVVAGLVCVVVAVCERGETEGLGEGKGCE